GAAGRGDVAGADEEARSVANEGTVRAGHALRRQNVRDETIGGVLDRVRLGEADREAARGGRGLAERRHEVLAEGHGRDRGRGGQDEELSAPDALLCLSSHFRFLSPCATDAAGKRPAW